MPSGLISSDFGTITRDDGKKQTTYKQMPLYYYVNDTKRGDTNGQGVNKAWYVAGTEATPVSTTVKPTPVATQNTYGGGYFEIVIPILKNS